MAESKKTLAENIRPKLIISAILAVVAWFGSKYAGFHQAWVIQNTVFVVIGFFFFILLDLPPMQDSKSGLVKNLIITFGFMSLTYVGITSGLPQFDFEVELAQINKPKPKASKEATPEAIAAGKEVFTTYKCWNCHKVWEEGSSDRGPNLGVHQIGLYTDDYIKEQIVDPFKMQAPGFDDEKSAKAMPDYFGEDISEDEMSLLIMYLNTLKSDKRIPVEGKLGEQWTWWDDPKIIEEGKAVYEGVTYPEANCSVCHGKDGVPAMTGAFDFKNKDGLDAPQLTTMPEMIAKFTKKPYKDWTDELYAERVFNGVDGSPMPAWAMVIPKLAIWKAMAYEKSFAFPVAGRPANPFAANSAHQPKTKQFEVPAPEVH